jgi:hypothetical protein
MSEKFDLRAMSAFPPTAEMIKTRAARPKRPINPKGMKKEFTVCASQLIIVITYKIALRLAHKMAKATP